MFAASTGRSTDQLRKVRTAYGSTDPSLLRVFHALGLRERVLQSAWSPVHHLRQRFRGP